MVRLTGLLHWDERHALKFIARQLCAAFGFKFRPGSSFEENLVFYNEVLNSISKCASSRAPCSATAKMEASVAHTACSCSALD